jgi:hypothetical protein
LAIRRDEKDANSHFALRTTHVFLGNFHQAVSAAEQGLDRQPVMAPNRGSISCWGVGTEI